MHRQSDPRQAGERHFQRLLYDALKNDQGDEVTKGRLLEIIQAGGIDKKDERISSLIEAMDELGAHDPIGFDRFCHAASASLGLIAGIIRHELIIPEFADFCRELESIFNSLKTLKDGAVADYIPELARVNPEYFGLSICTIDGQVFSMGDARKDFCIQSISKPVNYAIALEQCGEDEVHKHVGREPSGLSFNEIALNKERLPHNPMINAGAIVCNSLISPEKTLPERFEVVMDCWTQLTGGKRPRYNNSVYHSEYDTADRNFALAHYMREKGAIAKDVNIKKTLDFYFQCCAIEMNTEELAYAAAVFANAGVSPRTGQRLFCDETVRDCLSLMYSCGMYDFSGEYAFSVGLPAKSAVSGGLFIVVPNLMGITVWSPRLDQIGNSVRGLAFSRELIKRFNFHNYDSLNHSAGKKDPRNTKSQDENLGYALIMAAAQGDLDEIKRLSAYGVSLDYADYDKRTPLHLAVSEGRLEVCRYLVSCGAKVDVKDRWGTTPLADAKSQGYQEIAEVLAAAMGKGKSS